MSALQEFGIALIMVFQRWSPALDGFMEFITFFGTVEFYIIFIPFLYWTVNQKWGFRVFLILLFTDFISASFKLLLHQPRPYWVSEEVRLVGGGETSYGITSSHSSNPPAVLGYLAVHIRQRWMWVVAVVAPLLISYSRMHMGVHFPHDVVAGWILGILMLVLFVRYETGISESLQKRSTGSLIGLGFLISLVMITTSFLISAVIAGSPDPASYAGYASEARSLDHFFTLGGASFGSIAGYVLMRRQARFRDGGPVPQKAIRYVLGMIGALLLLYGLDFVFELVDAGEAVAFGLRYFRYGITTFWLTFGAPWVFLRLNLVEAGN